MALHQRRNRFAVSPQRRQRALAMIGMKPRRVGLAFGQRAAILDTNVARVLHRVFIGRGDPRAHAMRKQLWALSEALDQASQKPKPEESSTPEIVGDLISDAIDVVVAIFHN